MAKLKILHYPDKRLFKIAKPVLQVDDRVRQIVSDMAETMYAAKGIGLAATQVDIHERIIVIDVSQNQDQLQIFINPEIIWKSLDNKPWEEGCLSVPDVYDEVFRPERVRIKALDLNGKAFEMECDDILAVCIQHEIDHLNGRVFVGYLSNLKQDRIKTKMKKIARQQ